MTLLIPLLLAFLVIVISGHSMYRKGRWSRRAYLSFVAGMSVLFIALAGLMFYPRLLGQ
jgi:hypothetical protein